MNANKKNYTYRLIALVIAIVFLVYNVVLFVICGFKEHGSVFWISYVFMILSFVVFAICMLLVQFKSKKIKNWILNYSVFKKCCLYLILELIASVIFTALDYTDCSWVVAFVVQILLFACCLIFIISCFMAKEMIENVEIKANEMTSYTTMLKVEAEMIAERSEDALVKAAYKKLAEQFRYSDPIRNEQLSNLENQITCLIEQAKSVSDSTDLLRICDKVSLLIIERNKKIKILK